MTLRGGALQFTMRTKTPEWESLRGFLVGENQKRAEQFTSHPWSGVGFAPSEISAISWASEDDWQERGGA